MANPCARNIVRYRDTTSVPGLIVMLSVFALAGCETVEGFGKDLQSGGQAIEEASEDAR